MQRNYWLTAVVAGAIFAAVCGTAAGRPLTEQEIQERIAALSHMSMKSAEGNFIIVGTNRVESFALAKWCENAAERIGLITGIKPPFNGRKISISVGKEYKSDVGGAPFVRYESKGGSFASRVFAGSYDDAYNLRGRQAICCAILSLYLKDPARGMLDMPPWLWMGIEQNLLYDVRSRNLEQVLTHWRQAELPTLTPLLRSSSASDRGLRLQMFSVFVHFIVSQPEHRRIFKQLFQQTGGLAPEEMKDLICGPVDYDLEEAWTRWLLRQTQVVHTSVIVSTRTVSRLKAELWLYPGSCGIPLDAELAHGAPFRDLVKMRGADWLPAFISKKQGRLNMIAAGHSGILQLVIKRFNDYLSGLETDASDRLLLQRLDNAYTALKVLTDSVVRAGGMLYEKPPEQLQKVK